MATLLAAADWLPGNSLIDPDVAEFALTVLLGGSALVISIADRADEASIARWRNRLLLTSLTLAVSIAIAEPMTRFIFRNVTTSSDNGGYFSRRWYRNGGVSLNAAGFRERAFSEEKPAGAYRIAVIGDSFTFGNGIKPEERYSDLLQARLPSHFEVLNFGQAGANTPEHRNAVTKLIPAIHPDFVLLQWYVNDVEDDDSLGRPTFHPLLPGPLHNWLSTTSALYTVANMQWAETQVALGMTTSYTEYLQHRLGDPNGRDARIDREILRDLIATAEREHVPMGIVLFPDTAGDLGSNYPFGYLHDRVHETCAVTHITCLDLHSDFAQIKDHRTLWANQLDHHPSALANEIAAVRILQTFAPMWASASVQ